MPKTIKLWEAVLAGLALIMIVWSFSTLMWDIDQKDSRLETPAVVVPATVPLDKELPVLSDIQDD